MTEWQVFGVIVALVAFVTAIVRPVIKLNTSITRLTETTRHLTENIDRLVKDLAEQKEKSSESHRRIWAKNDEQDETLADHETRITILEKKN